MAEIPISLTCADYARVMPLATGEVKPEGIALRLILGSRGSWPAQYLYRIDKGDRRHVGLPVFPLRNFTARDLYVRRGGPIRKPADLAGKRIGMYSYTASGSIWYRHFLRFVGLDPAALEWWIGDIGRARVLPQHRRVSSAASDRRPARSVGGEPMDREAPHRGVQRRQRLLHRGPEGVSVRVKTFIRSESSGTEGRSTCSPARRSSWA
jgi:4,5-dihydroxyphthalate decarboxylase